MMSIFNKPRISDGVIWRRDGEDNQIILLSKEGLALPLILNPTAARIFLLCNRENTLEDIAKVLCAEFGLEDFKMVLEDVTEQVKYFIDKGIIEVQKKGGKDVQSGK